MLCLSSSVNAALIGLENGDADERAALVGTLTSMGHTVTTTIDGNLDLIITAPGNGTSGFPGVPYLQISDHGEDNISNAWESLPEGTPVTITIDGNHPILNGLSASWTTLGFWHYDTGSSDYVGWVNGIPGLADAVADGTTYNEVLAVSANSADIYIGWNVYGPDATPNDLLLLNNSINFLLGENIKSETAAVPTMTTYGLILTILAMFAVAGHRLRAARRPR